MPNSTNCPNWVESELVQEDMSLLNVLYSLLASRNYAFLFLFETNPFFLAIPCDFGYDLDNKGPVPRKGQARKLVVPGPE